MRHSATGYSWKGPNICRRPYDSVSLYLGATVASSGNPMPANGLSPVCAWEILIAREFGTPNCSPC